VFNFSSTKIISEIKYKVIRVRSRNDYGHEVPEKWFKDSDHLKEKLNTFACKKQIISMSN